MTPNQRNHQIMDAIGFIDGDVFTPYQGKAYPTRVFDTRQQGGGKVQPGESICTTVGNPGDILLANATVTQADAPGFATVGPTGADWNSYSTNNYQTFESAPNLTATKIGPDGRICMTPNQRNHQIMDAIGFIDGDVFTPYQGKAYPTRVFDTRSIESEPYLIQTSASGDSVDLDQIVSITCDYESQGQLASQNTYVKLRGFLPTDIVRFSLAYAPSYIPIGFYSVADGSGNFDKKILTDNLDQYKKFVQGEIEINKRALVNGEYAYVGMSKFLIYITCTPRS
jgi:hypothetical protein